jgi:riboflavin synthase alpha subunit
MFTGIIQKTARVTRFARHAEGARLSVENPWANDAQTGQGQPGESISVNGACLTVVSASEREISFDISAETLKKTTLGDARAGRLVNLERSLRTGQDISGHFVLGHVDGTGRVERFERRVDFAELAVEIPGELAVYVVPKGSIAIDGVSLTVASLEGNAVSVALIPETLSRTTLGALTAGDRVNIETDIIGKYVVRYLSAGRGIPAGEGVTLDRLEEAGF